MGGRVDPKDTWWEKNTADNMRDVDGTDELLAEAAAVSPSGHGQELRHINTGSDSEVLLNVFAEDVNNEIMANPDADTDKVVFDAVTKTMKKAKGAYSCITMVNQVGLFAFRDPNGIRPLVLGQRKAASDEEKDEWCVASEDSAFGPLGFSRVRDVNPGEAILITPDGKMESRQCVNAELSPCIFEYIYLARPDSTINSISVYEFQLALGRRLSDECGASARALSVPSCDAVPCGDPPTTPAPGSPPPTLTPEIAGFSRACPAASCVSDPLMRCL